MRTGSPTARRPASIQGLANESQVMAAKLQALSSKLQINTKHQAPKQHARLDCIGSWTHKLQTWGVRFGAYLELGAWRLEFSSAVFPREETVPQKLIWFIRRVRQKPVATARDTVGLNLSEMRVDASA